MKGWLTRWLRYDYGRLNNLKSRRHKKSGRVEIFALHYDDSRFLFKSRRWLEVREDCWYKFEANQ